MGNGDRRQSRWVHRFAPKTLCCCCCCPTDGDAYGKCHDSGADHDRPRGHVINRGGRRSRGASSTALHVLQHAPRYALELDQHQHQHQHHRRYSHMAQRSLHSPSFQQHLITAHPDPPTAHFPLQAPQEYLDEFAFVDDLERRAMRAMVHYMDHAIGQVVDAAKDLGLWDNMVVVVHSDNGGEIIFEGTCGGNNWPLRGGKFSNFEVRRRFGGRRGGWWRWGLGAATLRRRPRHCVTQPRTQPTPHHTMPTHQRGALD